MNIHYGETTAQSQDLADTFTPFSTKPFDAETSLVMCQPGHTPGLGRWMSRDPVGEKAAGICIDVGNGLSFSY